jgi:hypothetical protein
MLENEHGKRLPGFCNGNHWIVFKELVNEPALWDPLRAAVLAHVGAAVATYGTGGPGHVVTIDSTAAGPSVFGHMGAAWEAAYLPWQADLRRRKPGILKDVEPKQVEGMAVWHVLADLRPDERWQAPPFNIYPRVYKLLEVVRRATA